MPVKTQKLLDYLCTRCDDATCCLAAGQTGPVWKRVEQTVRRLAQLGGSKTIRALPVLWFNLYSGTIRTHCSLADTAKHHTSLLVTLVDAVAETMHLEWWQTIKSEDWAAVIAENSTPWRLLCRRIKTEEMNLESVVQLGQSLDHFLTTPQGEAVLPAQRAILQARVKILLQPGMLVLVPQDLTAASKLVFERLRELVPANEDAQTHSTIGELLRKLGPKSQVAIEQLEASLQDIDDIHVMQRLVANACRGIHLHGHYSSWEALHYFLAYEALGANWCTFAGHWKTWICNSVDTPASTVKGPAQMIGPAGLDSGADAYRRASLPGAHMRNSPICHLLCRFACL